MDQNFKKTHQKCPCGESSDAFAVRHDGGGYCFSCSKNFPAEDFDSETNTKNKKEQVRMEEQKFKYQYIDRRGITKKTHEFFDVKTAISEDNTPLFSSYPYANGRVINKSMTEKKFWFTGEKTAETGNLFGQDKFSAGCAKAVTITEGADDCLAVYQMFDSKYPVVSVTSASSAKTECAREYEYLNSFQKIYICFDSDAPGQKAAQEVARLFDFNKVYLVNLSQHKDPNEYLLKGKVKEFQSTWWNAKRFIPEGIVASYTEFDRIIDDDDNKPSVPYPLEKLQEMTYGIRTGELVLVTAPEGIGKTEIFRMFEHHLIKTTNDNIGIIHLEENKARTVKGLVGYELRAPIHLPDFAVPKEDIKKGFRNLTRRDERVHIYSHFGSDDPDVILSTVRFMAGPCNCKRIFMDHITMVVTGLQGEDERRALDYISTRLAMMVEELDFTLFLISHVNDDGQTRGSRNIGKVCDLRIDMSRNLTAVDDFTRNLTYLNVTKNRFAGKTGPAGRLAFDSDSFTLRELTELPEEADFAAA